MGNHGKAVPALCALIAVLVASALAAAPAGAAGTRIFEETFGSANKPAFGNDESLSVDQSTGDLLVVDATAKTVSRWHEDGTASNFSALGTNVIDAQGGPDTTPQNGFSIGGAGEVQVAVDSSGTLTDGNVYVTQVANNLVDIFASDGHFLGQLTKYVKGAEEKSFIEPCGVAVDASGAVYVGEFGFNAPGNGEVHKYEPSANPPVTGDNTVNFPSSGSFFHPCTLAAGTGPSAGYLFATRFSGELFKLDISTGAVQYEGEPLAEGVTTVSVDPVSGNVIAAKGSEVAEYDASGSQAPAEPDTLVKPGSTVEGIAVNEDTANLYIARAGAANVDVYGPPVPLPAVLTEPASAIGETGATLNGTVDPEGVELEECRFEYVDDAGYEAGAPDGPADPGPYAAGETIPCVESAEIGTGSEPVAVHADVSGLQAGVLYHYRLVAKNVSGPGKGEDETFAARAPPQIADEWVVAADYSEATLRALINPKYYPTTFRIEYGPDAAYGQSTAEIPVGSDGTLHTLSAELVGLTPGVTYHWRVVASSENGTSASEDHTFATYQPRGADSCPNAALRPGPGAQLPDCRAYEMVSPVDKNGGDIVAAETPGAGAAQYRQAALDGDKITYTATTAFGDARRGAFANQYLASRGDGGWASHGLNPPQGTTVRDPELLQGTDINSVFQAFTPDLCFATMEDQNLVPLTPDAIPGYTNAYLRDNCGPGADSYEALTGPEAPFSPNPNEPKWLVVNARNYSSDLGHIVFSGFAGLTPDVAPATAGYSQIYDLSEGELHLVSKLPGGEASTANNSVGTGSVRRDASLARAVSEDGSRVFWTTDPSQVANPGKIYVRIDNETTLPVSEPVTSAPATFWSADAEGSVAIFSAAGSLYEFDVDEALAGEAVPGEAASLIAGEVGGVAGTSEDLSRIYFTSKEALDAGAVGGEWNLYLREGGAVSLIATIALQDRGSRGVDAFSPSARSTRVSPDGGRLAFMSIRPLTGYDNTEAATGEAASEVFLYDAQSGELRCASCNPSGARPAGRKRFELQTAAWIPAWEWSNNAGRSLSDDGNRLFFHSFDALVPEDVNTVQDVYQWEAQNTGTCTSGDSSYSDLNGGCLSLISTGHGPADSEFVDASADGSDAFIATNSSIDPRDPGLIDIYDANVGGGYPPPAPEATTCVGDGCQNVPPPPDAQSPASLAYQGPGDPAPRPGPRPRPCAKGTVRRRGRCVAKKKKRKARRHRRAGR